jgi:hypothetical protein
MAEYTEDEARRAGRIVGNLLSRERSGFDLQQGLSIVDVEDDSDEFLGDLEILSAIGVDVPALRIGDKDSVPVSLSLIGPESFPLRRRGRFSPFFGPYFRDYLLDYYHRVLRADGDFVRGFERMSREQAQSSFLRRATDFLAVRIAAVRDFDDDRRRGGPSRATLNILQRPGGARISVPGCLFSVSTNSEGLRVFWSGGYYISGNYFGHPTTPAKGVLQAGSYVFGVDGGAYGDDVQWDTSALCTLPGEPSVHLNY